MSEIESSRRYESARRADRHRRLADVALAGTVLLEVGGMVAGGLLIRQGDVIAGLAAVTAGFSGGIISHDHSEEQVETAQYYLAEAKPRAETTEDLE
jgi:hypothetical protein